MAERCGNYCQKYKLNFVGNSGSRQMVRLFLQENLGIYIKLNFFHRNKI